MATEFNVDQHCLPAIILITIDIIVYLPIQFCTTLKFTSNIPTNYQHQDGYLRIVKFLNIFGILFTSIVHPQMIICSLLRIDKLYPSLYTTLNAVCHCSCTIVALGLCFMSLTRYWLIYYDLNILNSLTNGQWRLYLNSNSVQGNFWLKNRQKWGNKRYIIKSATIIYAILCISHCFISICSLLYIEDKDVLHRFNALFWIIPVIFGSTVYLKMPKMSKSHKETNNPILSSLKHELKVFVLAVMTLVLICLIALSVFIGGQHFSEMEGIEIGKFLLLGPYAFTVVILCLLTMRSAKHMYNGDDFGHGKIKEYSLVRNESDGTNMEMEQQIKLKQILCDENEIERFIKYLCQKFQLNTILCFIELVQFKYLLDGLFNITLNRNRYTLGTILENESTEYESKENDNYYEQCVLSVICDSEIIPKSDIVYGTNIDDRFDDEKKSEIMKECLRIAHRLYGKYIARNSQQCVQKLDVDISYTLKKCYDLDMAMSITEFVEKHSEDTYEDLFEYFDPIIDEMYRKLNNLCQFH